MGRLIGVESPNLEALTAMRGLGPCTECEACRAGESCLTQWYAYQNQDMSSGMLGHLQYLSVGPGRTYKAAPRRMPDTEAFIGWRYVLVGRVNLETGKIETE